jgi:hypothetical protein
MHGTVARACMALRSRLPYTSVHVTPMTGPVTGELAVLRDVSRRFEEGAIPYMVTGSLAMSFYTTPRMTRDIDIVAEIERRDIDR